jgi:hypothetical protein
VLCESRCRPAWPTPSDDRGLLRPRQTDDRLSLPLQATNLKAVRLIREGALGQVQATRAPRLDFWRMAAQQETRRGGPLFDVGIYSPAMPLPDWPGTGAHRGYRISHRSDGRLRKWERMFRG